MLGAFRSAVFQNLRARSSRAVAVACAALAALCAAAPDAVKASPSAAAAETGARADAATAAFERGARAGKADGRQDGLLDADRGGYKRTYNDGATYSFTRAAKDHADDYRRGYVIAYRIFYERGYAEGARRP